MGLAYLTPEQIKESGQAIRSAMEEKSNYFVRTGEVLQTVQALAAPQDHIVEIGCGAGELANELLKRGYTSLHLVDIGDYLKDQVKGKVELSLQDVCFAPLPFQNESMNLILAIAIVEHLENPFFLFRESHRVLKPGGKMVVAIPHIFTLRSRLSFLFHGDVKGYNPQNNHISLFTKAVFEKIILKDFRLVETRYSEGYIKIGKRKLSLGKWCKKWFGDKVMYILEKK